MVPLCNPIKRKHKKNALAPRVQKLQFYKKQTYRFRIKKISTATEKYQKSQETNKFYYNKIE